MHLPTIFALTILLSSFDFDVDVDFQVTTRTNGDTMLISIYYPDDEKSMTFKRAFKPGVFCSEDIFVNDNILLSNRMFWRYSGSSYFGADETRYLDNKALVSHRYNNTCGAISRDVRYRSFVINDTTTLEVEYPDKGNISNLISYRGKRHISGLEFDSINTTYQSGVFGDFTDSDGNRWEGIKCGTWYKSNF